MTLALFRIYATLVIAGIGSLWGWGLWFWLSGKMTAVHALLLGIPAMLVLCGGFGYFGFRVARELRGQAPEGFTWVTKAEFNGTEA